MSTHTEHAVDTKAETAKYLITLVALLILTAITVGASYINFGSGNIVIALTIATIKATIVALIFMHLLHDKPVNAVIAVAGFIFLGIFLMFDFIDVGSRTNPQPTNLHALPAATAPAAAGAPAAAAPAAAAPAKKE
jgi:cytochrome c oxidase subunit 4